MAHGVGARLLEERVLGEVVVRVVDALQADHDERKAVVAGGDCTSVIGHVAVGRGPVVDGGALLARVVVVPVEAHPHDPVTFLDVGLVGKGEERRVLVHDLNVERVAREGNL